MSKRPSDESANDEKDLRPNQPTTRQMGEIKIKREITPFVGRVVRALSRR
jgi:hypothetical protein